MLTVANLGGAQQNLDAHIHASKVGGRANLALPPQFRHPPPARGAALTQVICAQPTHIHCKANKTPKRMSSQRPVDNVLKHRPSLQYTHHQRFKLFRPRAFPPPHSPPLFHALLAQNARLGRSTVGSVLFAPTTNVSTHPHLTINVQPRRLGHLCGHAVHLARTDDHKLGLCRCERDIDPVSNLSAERRPIRQGAGAKG